jgi:hypothetical protein
MEGAGFIEMAKKNVKEESDKTKIKITRAILIQMEKAARLKVVTGFEKRLLLDRVGAVEQYSMGAVITEAQFEVIEEMAKRYDLVVRGSLDEEE